MSGRDKLAGEINDPIVEGALKHFKASIDAWSEAAYSQPRTVVRTAKHIWRLAAAWALGCLLAAASLAGAMHERHARQESARIAAIKAAVKIIGIVAPRSLAAHFERFDIRSPLHRFARR